MTSSLSCTECMDDTWLRCMDESVDTIAAYMKTPQLLDYIHDGAVINKAVGVTQGRWMQHFNKVLAETFHIHPRLTNGLMKHALLIMQCYLRAVGVSQFPPSTLSAACSYIAMKYASQEFDTMDCFNHPDALDAEIDILCVLSFSVKPVHDYKSRLYTILCTPDTVVDTVDRLERQLLEFPYIWYGKGNAILTCACTLCAIIIFCNNENSASQDILSWEMLRMLMDPLPQTHPLLISPDLLPLAYLNVLSRTKGEDSEFLRDVQERCTYPLVDILTLPRAYVYCFHRLGLISSPDELIELSEHIMASLYAEYS